MAQQTIVTIHDDLDGREVDSDGSTVRFSFEGRQYEIDLHSDNLRGFRDVLDSYIRHARPVRSRGAGKHGEADRDTKVDTKAVRAWAEQQGLTVSPRGRIAASVLERYRAATS